MKRTVFTFIALLLTISSCIGGQNSKEHEDFAPTNEELYEACKDLKGIGSFEIGKTTYGKALKSKEIKSLAYFWDKNNFYNGHWGKSFWYESPESSINDMEKARWLEKKAIIRQISPASSGDPIKVGELEFSTFDMAFLNDILVAIWFYPSDRDHKSETLVYKTYKEKYGNGRGSYDWTYYRSPGKTNISFSEKRNEHRCWENGKVVLKYDDVLDCQFSGGKYQNLYSKKSYIIYDKAKYPAFEETLMRLSKEYDDMVEKSVASSVKSAL